MKKKTNPELIKYKNSILILFFSVIILTGLINLFGADRDFSQQENRNLLIYPKVIEKSFKDGSFQKNLETYIQDQFIFRDKFISLKTSLEKFFFKQETSGVYINNKDFLISKFDKNSKETTDEKIKALNTFLKAHPELKTTFMFVPNKNEIYKDKLPFKNIEPSQKEYLDYLYENLDGRAKKIDLTKLFTDNKSRYLFFRNDHHWTQTGAFLAYTAFREATKITGEIQPYDIKVLSDSFFGTLTSKTGIESTADSLEVYIPREKKDFVVNIPSEKRKTASYYDTSKLSSKDKYLTFLGGNYPTVRISTTSPVDKRLLIIKDSYANSFVPFLTDDFNEIIMVDLRYFNGNIHQLIKDYNITDLLFLYNINTFNDDASILNLTDYLDEKGNIMDPELTDLPKNTDEKKDAPGNTSPSENKPNTSTDTKTNTNTKSDTKTNTSTNIKSDTTKP